MVATNARSFARIAARIAASLALVAGIATLGLAGFAWFGSEAYLKGFASPPPFTTAIPSDATTLANGEHLARTRGCHGCHGEQLQGEAHDWGGTAVAPNLALLARQQSPAIFERALRHGIGHDGRALYSMPSYNFIRLTDADVAAIIAYLRHSPVVTIALPKPSLAWQARWGLATGADMAVAPVVAMVPQLSWQQNPDPAVRRGEYLAMTSCNECHGLTLRGDDPFNDPAGGPPDLALVASYDRGDFMRLMRTGKAAGNRELHLMSAVARSRFVHWTDAEVDDLYAFLQAMGRRAAAEVAQRRHLAASGHPRGVPGHDIHAFTT